MSLKYLGQIFWRSLISYNQNVQRKTKPGEIAPNNTLAPYLMKDMTVTVPDSNISLDLAPNYYTSCFIVSYPNWILNCESFTLPFHMSRHAMLVGKLGLLLGGLFILTGWYHPTSIFCCIFFFHIRAELQWNQQNNLAEFPKATPNLLWHTGKILSSKDFADVSLENLRLLLLAATPPLEIGRAAAIKGPAVMAWSISLKQATYFFGGYPWAGYS